MSASDRMAQKLFNQIERDVQALMNKGFHPTRVRLSSDWFSRLEIAMPDIEIEFVVTRAAGKLPVVEDEFLRISHIVDAKEGS